MRRIATMLVFLCLTAAVLVLSGCATKDAVKADTTELIIDKLKGTLTYTNARDCDIELEMAAQEAKGTGESIGASAASVADVLSAIRKLKTTCGQNRGLQELRGEIARLQDARLRELEARLAAAIGTAVKVAPKPPGVGALVN